LKRKLPPAGAVLGIDVGFSEVERSSAACRLNWDAQRITWTIRRFRAVPPERDAVITAVAGNQVLQAVALDGPLRTGFEIIARYRVAERVLTRRPLGSRIGKPGQSNSPVGKRLNDDFTAVGDADGWIVLLHSRVGVDRH
jgi:hypothetical protein